MKTLRLQAVQFQADSNGPFEAGFAILTHGFGWNSIEGILRMDGTLHAGPVWAYRLCASAPGHMALVVQDNDGYVVS